MGPVVTLFLVVLFAGAVTTRITGWMMRSWLAANAGWVDSAGQRLLRYFFGIFVDLGTASQFMKHKAARGEAPTLAHVFYASFGVTVLGILGFVAALAGS